MNRCPARFKMLQLTPINAMALPTIPSPMSAMPRERQWQVTLTEQHTKQRTGPIATDSAMPKRSRTFSSIDGVEAVSSLADDVVLCLESSSNPEGAGLSVIVKALKYALSAGRDQLNKIRLAIDNTKSKTRAAQVHKRLTKADRMRAVFICVHKY